MRCHSQFRAICATVNSEQYVQYVSQSIQSNMCNMCHSQFREICAICATVNSEQYVQQSIQSNMCNMCHSQFRAICATVNSEQYVQYVPQSICADMKENKIVNLTKQGDESRPPHVWRWQTTYRSVHKVGSGNNGVYCSFSPSLQFQFTTLWLPTFWPPDGFTPRALFCRQRLSETLCMKCLDPAAKILVQLACSHAEVEKLCLCNEGYFV
jgi:hypothetical protein